MKTKRKNMKKKNFTRKDYNSKDGMLTRVWGPSLWHVLHTISFNYPVEPTYKDKVNYFITKHNCKQLQKIIR